MVQRLILALGVSAAVSAGVSSVVAQQPAQEDRPAPAIAAPATPPAEEPRHVAPAVAPVLPQAAAMPPTVAAPDTPPADRLTVLSDQRSAPSVSKEPAAPSQPTPDAQAAPAPQDNSIAQAAAPKPVPASTPEPQRETRDPSPQPQTQAAEQAETPHAEPAVSEAPPSTPPAPAAQNETAPAPVALSPAAIALRGALDVLPAGGTDEERNERAALLSFYEARNFSPLWLTARGDASPKASEVIAEIKISAEWGLEARDFRLPALPASSPEAAASAEVTVSQAVLKYGRYARGGRIIDPAEQLSSYLDRRPQLLKPTVILDGIAAAEQPAVYLRGLHPSHPQFERLRQKYVALLRAGKQQGAEAKRYLANMEEWRWMPADMGTLYVWNNLPDFTQRVVKDGKIVREVRIVGGEVGKQTPIFSRPMRKITFKPTWIVPDSIKVRELWPSMLKGGRLMREWGLEVTTKEGKMLDWRRMDWTKVDIREYEVIQPNGPKSVMGKVKFSFPNQHTVFMHDTLERDKWMFKSLRRTYSHGCMRVANPIGLAEIILKEDRGWDGAKVREAFSTGPLNNEIALEHKVPVHMTYFTVLVDDDGTAHTFADVYGHEKRITLALEGKWNQIVKGRNHLAPVELNLASAERRSSRHAGEEDAIERPSKPRRDYYSSGGGFLDALLGRNRL